MYFSLFFLSRSFLIADIMRGFTELRVLFLMEGFVPHCNSQTCLLIVLLAEYQLSMI